MIKQIVTLAFTLIISFTSKENKTPLLIAHNFNDVVKNENIIKIDDKNLEVYYSLNTNGFSLPNTKCFVTALSGFENLKNNGKISKNVLTIINYDLPSTEKRLWVIDLNEYKVLFNTYVSHGRNSGELYATDFSNDNESFKSSLGFYATAEIYTGNNGLSLKLDGLEKGINDHARQRAIVIHGADYVSPSFIAANNKLGRSHGCPALPIDLNEKIIKKISNKSCLFIYQSNSKYQKTSKLIS
jgi:hypothetical protein